MKDMGLKEMMENQKNLELKDILIDHVVEGVEVGLRRTVTVRNVLSANISQHQLSPILWQQQHM